jgi:hypothetical protein
MKYFKLTFQYFFEEVINKNENPKMYLEIRTYH